MRAAIGVTAVALFFGAFKVGAVEDRLPAMTPADMERCEAQGGCLIITREALARIIAEKEKAALVACRNFL